jgi:hypothetical protein
MDKLAELISRCQCGVSISVNEYRNYHDSAGARLAELDERPCPPLIAAAVRARIINSGELIELKVYLDTPIGFCLIVHHDLAAALDEALRLLDEKRSKGHDDAGDQRARETGGSG